MTCEQHQMNLSAILDGESGDFDPSVAMLHMSTCVACHRFVKQSAGLSQHLQGWQLESTALAQLGSEEQRDERKNKPWHPRPLQWALPLAAAALLILSFLQWAPSKDQPPLQIHQLSKNHQAFSLGKSIAGMKPHKPACFTSCYRIRKIAD